MNSATTKTPEQQLCEQWQAFLGLKDQSTGWQKALLKMLNLDNLPADLRLEIGTIVLQEAPNMSFGMRQDAYCLVTWLVPELTARAWASAQEIGVSKADLQLFMLTYPIKSAISSDDAKTFIKTARAKLTDISQKVGKKVGVALETSPFHDLFTKMKDLANKVG